MKAKLQVYKKLNDLNVVFYVFKEENVGHIYFLRKLLFVSV